MTILANRAIMLPVGACPRENKISQSEAESYQLLRHGNSKRDSATQGKFYCGELLYALPPPMQVGSAHIAPFLPFWGPFPLWKFFTVRRLALADGILFSGACPLGRGIWGLGNISGVLWSASCVPYAGSAPRFIIKEGGAA